MDIYINKWKVPQKKMNKIEARSKGRVWCVYEVLIQNIDMDIYINNWKVPQQKMNKIEAYK